MVGGAFGVLWRALGKVLCGVEFSPRAHEHPPVPWYVVKDP